MFQNCPRAEMDGMTTAEPSSPFYNLPSIQGIWDSNYKSL